MTDAKGGGWLHHPPHTHPLHDHSHGCCAPPPHYVITFYGTACHIIQSPQLMRCDTMTIRVAITVNEEVVNELLTLVTVGRYSLSVFFTMGQARWVEGRDGLCLCACVYVCRITPHMYTHTPPHTYLLPGR